MFNFTDHCTLECKPQLGLDQGGGGGGDFLELFYTLKKKFQ